MWPTRALGTSSSTASSIPRPARSTGHDDDVRPTAGGRAPARAASRRSTVVVGTSRSASAASSTLMRVAARRKCSGVVRLSRSVDERVVHQRVIDDVDRHGPTLYNFSTRMRAQLAVRRSRSLLPRRSPVWPAQARRAAPVSLIVIGGTVITRERHAPGAVARAPSRSTAPTSSTSDARRRSRRGTRRRRPSTRATRSCCPG